MSIHPSINSWKLAQIAGRTLGPAAWIIDDPYLVVFIVLRTGEEFKVQFRQGADCSYNIFR